MGITQSIFKLGPPAFAWQQIQIIATDNDYDDNNDDNDDDDDDNDNDDGNDDDEKLKWA